MKLRYSSQALDDLETIFTYLNERNPKGAAATNLRVRSALRGRRRAPRCTWRSEDAGAVGRYSVAEAEVSRMGATVK